jgi:riboflavin kinase/FMN adenylyltransferase
MNVLTRPEDAPRTARAVAIGTFDGVHRGHRAVLDSARATGLRSAALTFEPHPRAVLGYAVELLTTYERRRELLVEAGVDDVLVVPFTSELARLVPEEFVDAVLRPFGTRVVLAGEGFRFGKGRRGDLDLLRALGFEIRPVPLVHGVSSTGIRELLREGEIREAADLLGRPPELEGVVVAGDQRGGTLGYPTANLAVPPELLVPAYGIYAGEAVALDHPGAPRFRTALSIGVNPHYGGVERRIEAFLLDFDGDLYGRPLRIELWDRLREERSFASEAELVEQIGRDVAAARAVERPTENL